MASLVERFFGPVVVFLHDNGSAWRVRTAGTMGLVDEAPQDTLIKDSVQRVKDQLSQIPEGKTKALVLAVDWKGMMPTASVGYAARMDNGWEVHGEAFISKAGKGASVRAVKTW